jgi:hypothetical protein
MDGARLDGIIKSAIVSYMETDAFVGVLQDAMLEVAKNAPPHARPKTRAAFVWNIGAEIHNRHGETVAHAMRIAPGIMHDLEDMCAPWGHADYEWDMGAIREWLEDVMEDR